MGEATLSLGYWVSLRAMDRYPKYAIQALTMSKTDCASRYRQPASISVDRTILSLSPMITSVDYCASR